VVVSGQRIGRRLRIGAVLAATIAATAGWHWFASWREAERSVADASPRWVRTVAVRPATANAVRLSGTVRARFETPLAFQVSGRVVARHVDAGQHVAAGKLLLELDPLDARQQLAVARADLRALEAELATAAADTHRHRDLLDRKFISTQVFERVQLTEDAVRERVDAARARLRQAESALGYTRLVAPRAGILLEVTGEPGQVVAPGEPVGILAEEGTREIEVFLPDRVGVPETARTAGPDLRSVDLALREVAGAADPVTRTWAARYSILDSQADFRLGSVVKLTIESGDRRGRVFEVPIGAINERGRGPQVWIIDDGHARPVPVELLDVDAEVARIVADLPDEARVIALGTHLLVPGQPVRALD
jgi:RND family efflux transporter MFP subunit